MLAQSTANWSWSTESITSLGRKARQIVNHRGWVEFQYPEKNVTSRESDNKFSWNTATKDGISPSQWYICRRQQMLARALLAHYTRIGNKTMAKHLQKWAFYLQNVWEHDLKKKGQDNQFGRGGEVQGRYSEKWDTYEKIICKLNPEHLEIKTDNCRNLIGNQKLLRPSNYEDNWVSNHYPSDEHTDQDNAWVPNLPAPTLWQNLAPAPEEQPSPRPERKIRTPGGLKGLKIKIHCETTVYVYCIHRGTIVNIYCFFFLCFVFD